MKGIASAEIWDFGLSIYKQHVDFLETGLMQAGPTCPAE